MAQKGVESCTFSILVFLYLLYLAKLELPVRSVQYEPTRWNFSYYMLQWLVEQKKAVLAVCAVLLKCYRY